MAGRPRAKTNKTADHAEALKKTLKQNFIDAFKKGGALYYAAEAIGYSVDTVSRWRKEDPDFDAAILAADEHVTDTLKLTAFRRALEGKTKGSDTLLIFLIKGRDPRYRDSFDINARHSGAIAGTLKVAAELRASFKGLPKELLQKLAEKL